MKTLYEFTVEIDAEVEKEETVVNGDQTITVKRKVIEPVPKFFAFKKPSRNEREEADAYRAQQWTIFIQKGILSEALLIKEYANNGGILSQEQAKRWLSARMELHEKMEEYQFARTTKDDVKAVELMREIITLQDEVTAIQREQSVFFENTAEARARNKLTQYLVLTFTYTRDSAEKPWEPYFKGTTIDQKFESLDAFDEAEDSTFAKVWARVEMLAVLYLSAGGAITKDDVKTFDDQFQPVDSPIAPPTQSSADVSAATVPATAA